MFGSYLVAAQFVSFVGLRADDVVTALRGFVAFTATRLAAAGLIDNLIPRRRVAVLRGRRVGSPSRAKTAAGTGPCMIAGVDTRWRM